MKLPNKVNVSAQFVVNEIDCSLGLKRGFASTCFLMKN